MQNGPELWDKILSHFPEGSVIAGGAVRDYLLGVEPKDFDVFGSYSTYDVNVEGMEHLNLTTDVEVKLHEEEYSAMREIAIVMKGEIEGVKVDYIGHHLEDPIQVIESFDTGISQVFYAMPQSGGLFPGGVLYKKKAFLEDVENKTVTVLRGDRIERTKARFERFNVKMNGEYTLVIPEGIEIISPPIVTVDFDPVPF